MASLRRRRIKILTMEDFKGRREAIERRGREFPASCRGFFYLTEVAAIATEKLTMVDNNGVVGTAITTSSYQSNFNLRSKRSPTTRPAISINEEDSVLNAKKKSKTATVKTNIQGNRKEDDKRVKQERRKVVVPNPPPDLPQEFKKCFGEMEGREVTLVIQKRLLETDLKKGEGRLSIPTNQIQNDNFLTDEEKESLNKLDE
ncbi:hypothetical protein K2173_023401 [Erythroxylum novogranatense]|uniref:Uncharacterized protein n=1 Tax=Erythroxylum novogranatense TaxID=1862640 RepID=A0AAV8TX12_9ROSI|nr:hypothetical protein K2173_023401 [Erythroxylum novogranatense]